MADIKSKYGSSGQALTVTVASLANNGARESTVIDNTSNVFLDALLFLKIKSAASATSASGYVNVYAYATADGGSNYTESATGSDAAITLVSPTNLRFVGAMNIVANATTYRGGPLSIAAAFGGVMPDKWGIVIENKTGGTLDTTGGNHSIHYQGVYAQAV